MKEIRLKYWMALVMILPAMFTLGGIALDVLIETDILGMTGLRSSIWMMALVMIGFPSLAFILVQGTREGNAIVRLTSLALSVVLISDVVFFIAACVKAV